MRRLLSCFLFAFAPAAIFADDAPPKSLDPRLKIELFAEHPQIVTPTGIDVDHLGRVWAIENNTHFQPEGYSGHPTDRVLVMRDANGDGRADQIVVFVDGLRDTMSVALRPLWFPASGGRQPPEGKTAQQRTEPQSAEPQKSIQQKSAIATVQGADAPRSPILSVYIATRRDITLYHDDNGDLKPDRHERIVTLETAGNYPHNALAGFAFDALGWMYFGFGENLGESYKVIGSDGTKLSGGGEGGNVYRCRLDGTKLEQWATGFWNPHASCIDAFGRLFTVNNDPDSRPPCRLLHVIRGGDYGFRFRNGRKGLHPFTSWNGEIAGTLPMVSGTGEAPSGILAYESDGLPDDYIGNLLVTSWGDHRIDRFRLKPRGASFESLPEPVILGGQDFRPVGIACAPDGSLYCTDWMLYDYRVHRKGRVWRVSQSNAKPKKQPDSITTAAKTEILQDSLRSVRLDNRRVAANVLRHTPAGRTSLKRVLRDDDAGTRSRVEALNALALVPITDEELRVFVVMGESEGFDQAASPMNELTTTFFNVLCDDIPQRPLRGEKEACTFLGEGLLGAVLEEEKAPGGRWPDPTYPLSILHQYCLRPPDSDDPGDELQELLSQVIDRSDAFMFSAVISGIKRGLDIFESAHRQVAREDKFVMKFVTEKRLKLLRLIEHSLDSDQTRSPKARLAFLLGARKGVPGETRFPKSALADPDSSVRRAAVQWVAEERLSDLRPQVEAILNDPTISADLFLATLAALEMLDGVKPVDFDKTPAGKYVLPMVQDEKRPASVRALALRLVDPAEPALDAGLLGNLLGSQDQTLKLEAVRTLQQSPVAQASSVLRTVAADETLDVNLRAEAVVGLARPEADGRLAPETRDLLLKLLAGDNAALRREALRALGGVAAQDAEVKRAVEKLAKGIGEGESQIVEAKRTIDGSGGLHPRLAGEKLRAALAEPTLAADHQAAGRRAFYHPQGAGCFKCHMINGRGGNVGPDLSSIGKLSRERLIDSILEPSREIAPQFVTWALETADGKVHTGMIVRENADSGSQTRTIVGDSEGRTTELRTVNIVSRTPQKTSIMPEKLHERLSLQEFRDLLAYLESLK